MRFKLQDKEWSDQNSLESNGMLLHPNKSKSIKCSQIHLKSNQKSNPESEWSLEQLEPVYRQVQTILSSNFLTEVVISINRFLQKNNLRHPNLQCNQNRSIEDQVDQVLVDSKPQHQLIW